MARDDARVRRAERARRLHVLEPAHDEHLAAHQARHARPADDADHHEDERQGRADGGGDGDEQEQRREGEGDVGEAHDRGVHPAAGVPGDEAQRQPQGAGDGLTDETDRERQARAEQYAREHIPSLHVGPEQERTGRRVQAFGKRPAQGIPGGHPRRDEREKGEADHEDQARHRPTVVREASPE